MAIHDSVQSMLSESLQEMIFVAKYCIESQKNDIWGSSGCYGYPAAIILLSVVDSIGSYILKGNIKNRFKILNYTEYYNLKLDDDTLEIVYDYYRNTLFHHSVLTPNIMLDIGQPNEKIIQKINSRYLLRLRPFYDISDIVVNKFLNNNLSMFVNNKTIENIQKKI